MAHESYYIGAGEGDQMERWDLSSSVSHCMETQRDVTAPTYFVWRLSCTFSDQFHLLQIIPGPAWGAIRGQETFPVVVCWYLHDNLGRKIKTTTRCPSLCGACTLLQCAELTLSGSKTHGLWSPDPGLQGKDEVSYQSLMWKKKFNKNIDASMSFQLYEEPQG